ncbi:hypothetical protein GQ457_12G027370 [Hibiscus cannabinus]
MSDFVQQEHINKMNARNIAMVFAANMSRPSFHFPYSPMLLIGSLPSPMPDPLTALMYAECSSSDRKGPPTPRKRGLGGGAMHSPAHCCLWRKMKTTLEVVQAAQRWSTKGALRPSRRACMCAPKGLVSESCDDVGDHTTKNEMKKEWQSNEDKTDRACGIAEEIEQRKRLSAADFVHREVREAMDFVKTPMQELLHAFREDGRLKLQFMLPNDDSMEQQ